ncbi:MAG: LysM peptidoglycan-binding domain-containing protein [Actinobacteria bacterium]|nr:LysM peptidoglycan-binding domain-containing protein [Actinomycetota bacterium]
MSVVRGSLLSRTDVRRVSPLSTFVLDEERTMTTIAINPSINVSGPRLTRRGRFFARLALIASLSILPLAGFYLVTGSQASSESSDSPYVKVTVQPGETLWSIAAKISDGDRRALVDEILEVNNLKNSELIAGQKLYLPTRP